MKAREPLVAVILSCLLPGLGQMYSGSAARGWVLLSAALVFCAGAAYYILNPAFKVDPVAVILLVLSCGFYVYILVDSFLAAKKFNAGNKLEAGTGPVKKILLAAAAVLLAIGGNPMLLPAAFVKSFTAVPESMEPSVYGGEKVLADLFLFTITGPKRGDIFVYRSPGAQGVRMHRIVGLPGETVELREQSVIVNGAPLTAPWAKRYYNRGDFAQKEMRVTVPQGCYYMLWDYTTRSNDSRFTGFVSQRNLVGRVFKRYYPFKRSGKVE